MGGIDTYVMETLHIAGTNGKGSVATYAATILGLNHKTGLYTSPHLVDPTERFVLNGEPIGKLAMSRLVAASQREREGTPFVHWTHAAKQWFEQQGAEYAVIETGLGGRLDTTNIFDSHYQVLTTISFDHTDILGETLGEIASEKAGIIRPDSVVITARQQPEAMRAIDRSVDDNNADLVMFDPINVKDYEPSIDGQKFSFRQDGLDLENVFIQALAPGQVENACIAALAAHEMGISAEEIKEGLRRTILLGRAQIVTPDVVIDGAHNPMAMLELRRVITRNFPGRGVIALFGAMKDKDIAGMARTVNAFANEIYCTQVDSPRALRLPQYKRYFRSGVFIENPLEAAAAAYDRATRNGDLFVVCGSFYLIKPALQAIGVL